MAEQKVKIGNSGQGDPELIKSYIERIENVMSDIDELKSECAATVFDRLGDIKHLKEAAKEAGIDVKAMNVVLKQRTLENKVLKLEAALDIVERAAADTIRHALGMQLTMDLSVKKAA